MGAPAVKTFNLVIQGPNIEMIDYYSNAIMEALAQNPAMSESLEILKSKPEVRVQIDREKAADAGIRVRDIASTVGALIGGVEVAQFRRERRHDIRVRLDPGATPDSGRCPTDLDSGTVMVAGGH